MRTDPGTPALMQRAPAVRAGARVAPVVVVVVVLALAVLPLVRERAFYYWDDTAAVFVPTWRAAGLDLLAGHWPTMRPDFWMGGNWAGEAQFGLWSPVNLAICVLAAVLPNMAIVAALVTIGFLLVLALGTYALLRTYAVTPAWSVAVATALPFAGFTLYYDAATWIAGLAAFAWTPWFWWAARRTLHGAGNPFVTYAVGYLLVTNGNPYGVVSAIAVLAALAVEGVLTHRRAGLARLTLAGVCVGTAVGVAYLPMLATASVGWRGEFAALRNDGQLVPDLTQLLATSIPHAFAFLPRLVTPDPALASTLPPGASTVPITYTLWFLVPLLPWLSWSTVRRQARDLTAPLILGVGYLLLTIGPSQFWLFRWPIRLLPYTTLAVVVVIAVVASAGLATDHRRSRTLWSLGLTAAGCWVALAQQPERGSVLITGTVLCAFLVGALIVLARRRAELVPALAVVGTAVVLVAQLSWAPANRDVMNWYLPTTPETSPYAQAYTGPIVQIARPTTIAMADRPAAYRVLLPGSQPGLVGRESTTSYSGIGFNAFSRSLCLDFGGQACPEAFGAIWAPAGTSVPVPHLADAVKARTIVVQNTLVPEAAAFDPPTGWSRSTTTDLVTVFTRTTAVPWPQSRLAATSGGITVSEALGTATSERVLVSTGGEPGALQFARLAWPGYRATLDGEQVPVTANAQGLIEIPLPAGRTAATVVLEFTPPGYRLAIPALGIGALAAAVLGLATSRRWRRGSTRITVR